MAISTRSRLRNDVPSNHSRSKRISYRELSSSSEDDSYDESTQDDTARPRRTLRNRSAVYPSQSGHPTSKKRKAAPAQPQPSHDKKARVDASAASDEKKSSETRDAVSSSKIPGWHTLPYHILVQIFHYTSQPLIDEAQLTPATIAWLLRTARICKAFCEPALTVLYYNPPLDPPRRAHSLLAHLRGQDDHSLFNYRAKVRYLDVQISFTLCRRYQGQYLEIADLLALVPQLRGLGMHRVEDMLKATAMLGEPISSRVIRVLQDTIEALQLYKPALRQWKWNAVASKGRKIFDLHKIHRTMPFQSLQRLILAHFDAGKSQEKLSEKPEEELAASISVLSNLTELRFVLCNDLNAKLLPLLPHGLRVLEISDCPVDSKSLGGFLSSHGKELRRLILDHNQSLNLAFLTDLATSCPALEVLKMDLTYHNTHYTFTDIEPRYAELLLPGQIPTWPSSIQHLELIHLRKWNNDTANGFFTSLVDSASDLPDLRRLILKASLNESNWRERISFRDRWTARLLKVFLRKAAPPNPYIYSIAAFSAAKAKYPKGIPKHKTPRKSPKVVIPVTHRHQPSSVQDSTPPKRNLRSKPQSQLTAPPDSSSDSDAPLVTQRRRSSRLARDDSDAYTSQNTPQRPQRRYRRRRRSGNPDEDSSSEDSALDDPVSAPTTREASVDINAGDDAMVIQGMCDVVKIQIDNLRPMEEIMVEDDFIDEEAPGDGDWNGDDVDEGDGLAW